jgi:hypothetical protein
VALGRLSNLQERVLVALAGIQPPWTLSGGAALAGFHTAHRETRDLDLFWQRSRELGDVARTVSRRLEDAGFEVTALDTRATFSRLNVRDGAATVTVDLVADPVPLAEAPRPETVGGATFLVDTPHQILVNKLCALLNRSELRDIEDIKALLDSGGDLTRALEDCPRQDGGFSPMTLSWSLRSLPIERLATALGWGIERIDALARFRDGLLNRVLEQARPDH